MRGKVLGVLVVLVAIGVAACEDAVAPIQREVPNLRVAFGQNIPVNTSQNLKAIIEGASSGDTISLGSGDFYLPAQIVIQNKSNFIIRGNGQGITRIHPSDTANFAFELRSNLSQLTIQDLSIIGTTSPTPKAEGIGKFTAYSSVSGLYFQRLELRDLKSGITVSGPSCDDVTIYGNTIVGMHERLNPEIPGSTSGSGYGIQNGGCTHIRIAENYIEATDRHGIYQAYSEGPVTIEHNLVLNDLKYGTIQANDPNLVSIVVINTKDAAVGFNSVINPYGDAMSVEYSTADAARPNIVTGNVQLIGNSVVGARQSDLFITVTSPVQLWGNKYYHRGSIGPSNNATIRTGGQAVALDTPTVAYTEPKWKRWWGSHVLAAHTPGNDIFVLQNAYVHKVTKAYWSHPDIWNYTSYKGPYSAVQAMVADANSVYLMNSNTLYALNTTSSPWTQRNSTINWAGFEGMTISAGELYIIKIGYLYHVNPTTFDYSSPTPRNGWLNTQALVGFNGRLFIMQNDCTHEVSTSTLWYTRYWC
jgi:hypothetical protein